MDSPMIFKTSIWMKVGKALTPHTSFQHQMKAPKTHPTLDVLHQPSESED